MTRNDSEGHSPATSRAADCDLGPSSSIPFTVGESVSFKDGNELRTGLVEDVFTEETEGDYTNGYMVRDHGNRHVLKIAHCDLIKLAAIEPRPIKRPRH